MTIKRSDIMRRVLQAMPLPPAWATPKQVYAKMDCGAYITVKMALHALHQDGTLAKFGPVMSPCYRRIDISDVRYPPLGTVNVLKFPEAKKAGVDYQDRLRQWKAAK